MLKFITHRPFWVNVIAGFLVMVICLFLLYILLAPLTRHGKNKTVPSVLGKSFEEAKQILKSQGFDIELQDSIYVGTAMRGSVLKQIPEGDELVKISRTVYLTINRHVPPVVEMPNLIGYSYRNAEMQLENMGLRIGDTSFKPDFAKNSVLEQWYDGSRIVPGTKIQQGSSISLVLGSGVGDMEFAVPGLIGITFSEAQARLQVYGLGLIPIVDPTVEDTSNAFIYRQEPERFDEEGKRLRIRSGQIINVWLSSGRPIIDTSSRKEPGL